MCNEDYDRELLAAVTVICAALTVAIGVFETATPLVAGAVAQQPPVRVERLDPVRIVGTPFVPNTNPSVR